MKNLSKYQEIITATGNWLDYLYNEKYHKLNGTDLWRQINTSIPEQINFAEWLERNDGATMFVIACNWWKTVKKYS